MSVDIEDGLDRSLRCPELRAPTVAQIETVSVSAGRCQAFLPLPGGEGWGEGESANHFKQTKASDRSRCDGYTMLGFMVVLFGLSVVSIVVATNLLGRVSDKNQRREEGTLDRIRHAFLASVARTQTIPTHTNWLTALAPFASLDQTGLGQAHPEWGTNSTLSRAFLVDTNLPATLLPYRQPASGLSGSATNLLGTASRVLIVSSTKRGLALPVSSGVVASNSFNAIWDWDNNPATKAPPSGWSSWTGMGEFLHVERFNLASLFHQVTFQNLRYGVAGGSSVTNTVTSQIARYFLQGTPLWLAKTDGTIKRAHVVTRSASFDLGGSPFLYYAFTETSGAVATNSGTAGWSANGVYTNGVTLGAAGPRSPTFTNYSSVNTGITLDGVNDYVKGTNGLLNNLTGFTVAGWIYPTVNPIKNLDCFGQKGIAELGFQNSTKKLDLRCAAGSQVLTYTYGHSENTWHHLAGVGDGVNMLIYLDGALVASRAYVTASYGTSTNSFNVGGNVFGTGHYFEGSIDEVVVYNRALSAAEVALVYKNQLP